MESTYSDPQSPKLVAKLSDGTELQYKEKEYVPGYEEFEDVDIPAIQQAFKDVNEVNH